MEDSSNQLNKFNKSKSFMVPFSTPDSNGVCKIDSLTDSNMWKHRRVLSNSNYDFFSGN